MVLRLIAARRGRAYTVAEIVQRSGLSRSTVIRLSKKLDWKNVDLDTAIWFTHGCGFQYLKTWPQMERVKKLMAGGLSSLSHLRVKPGQPGWKHGSMGMRMKVIAGLVSQR